MPSPFTPDTPTVLTPQSFAPGAMWMSGEESLRITTWNMTAAVEVTVFGRYLTPDGIVKPFAFKHVPNTDRTPASNQLSTLVGWLLNVSAIASAATPLVGGCYALLKIVRGDTGAIFELVTIAGGYLTAQQPVSYPASLLRTSLEGPGIIRSVTGTDPAAGAEISEAVPTGARWRLISMSANLVTSGVAGNRDVQIVIDDGANVVYQGGSATNQAASLTFRYVFAPLGEHINGAGVNVPQVVTPVGLIMIAGQRFRTSTFNLDVGDNWGAPQMLVEEWEEVK